MTESEYKAFAEVKELTAEGQLEAIISTFGPDRDGDIMTADAFKSSDGKSIPMVWSHDWGSPIGKGTVSVNAKNAVFKGQFNLSTTAGREAYEAVKFMGPLQQYSIGFMTKQYSFVEESGQRFRQIEDLELFEASPVLVGAAFGTGTLAVKESKGDIHEQIKALKEQHDASCELGDECPFTAEDIANAEIVEVDEIQITDEPESELAKALRELEAELGYRPLIADRLF